MTIERGTAWAVENWRGGMFTDTVARTRVKSIKRMVGPEEGWRTRWRYWYRNGCRCVRVRLVRVGAET